MCGRYSAVFDAAELASELEATLAVEALPRHANLAPSMLAPMLVARPERRIGLASFGLVPPWADRVTDAGTPKRFVNARAETLATTRSFRAAAERRRCLLPADGFYEWKKEGRKKQPYYLHAKDGHLLTFAGIYEVGHEAGHAAKKPSFAIVTRPALGFVETIHDRMPLVIPPALRDAWLSAEDHDAAALVANLLPLPAVELEGWPVSPRLNDPRVDDPSLREPIPFE